MTRNVVVEGVGQTEFGNDNRGLRQLGADAAKAALADTQFDRNDIDAAYVGNVGTADPQTGIVGQYCLREVGITGIPITNMENACSSSACAFRHAYRDVAAGFEDTVLVLGTEKMTGLSTADTLETLASAADYKRESTRGMSFSSVYSMQLKAYQEKYDPQNLREVLAQISVKNHRNALSNPYAHLTEEVTKEDVLESPIVTEPMVRLYDSCPISDGAAATIITAEDTVANDSGPTVRIEASVHHTGEYDQAGLADASGVAEAANEAYEMAGIDCGDVDLFEVHDATTFGELQHAEALGLCEPGEGSRLVQEGETEIEGELPMNPSGGLKARGHPVGATGVAQINELTWQLRGNADGRQVQDARIGLAENGGGALNGVTANHTIHILRRI